MQATLRRLEQVVVREGVTLTLTLASPSPQPSSRSSCASRRRRCCSSCRSAVTNSSAAGDRRPSRRLPPLRQQLRLRGTHANAPFSVLPAVGRAFVSGTILQQGFEATCRRRPRLSPYGCATTPSTAPPYLSPSPRPQPAATRHPPSPTPPPPPAPPHPGTTTSTVTLTRTRTRTRTEPEPRQAGRRHLLRYCCRRALPPLGQLVGLYRQPLPGSWGSVVRPRRRCRTSASPRRAPRRPSPSSRNPATRSAAGGHPRHHPAHSSRRASPSSRRAVVIEVAGATHLVRRLAVAG